MEYVLVPVLLIIVIASIANGCLELVKISKTLKKAHKLILLQKEMEMEFKATCEAMHNHDWNRYFIHSQRWHELYEALERDFK